MNTLDDAPDPSPARSRLLVTGGVVLLLLVVAGGGWLLFRQPAPATSAPVPAAATPAPPPAAAPEVAAAPEPPPSTPAPVRRAPKKAATPVATPPASPSYTLKIDSDVPGASVFVDRVYLGKTPLSTSDVAPGSHALNVSAEGYESHARTIELAGGPTDVMVRFKVVRLNEELPVVHKHAIGSCDGRLLADPDGLAYETVNKEHAFRVAFAEIKAFDIDYLKKNLRVTRSDGKTYNFTDRNPNADALFVFHKKVAAARAKLAAGMTPER